MNNQKITITLQNKKIILENKRQEVFVPKTLSLLLAESLKVKRGERVLDIGTGNGIFAILAKKLGALEVDAVDVSYQAVDLAKHNARLNKVKINCFWSDLLLSIKIDNKYDCIILDVPQIPDNLEKILKWHIDPLPVGASGLRLIKEGLKQSKSHLSPKGRIYLPSLSLADWRDLKRVIRRQGFTSRIISQVSIPFSLLLQTALPELKKPLPSGASRIWQKNNLYWWKAWIYELKLRQ